MHINKRKLKSFIIIGVSAIILAIVLATNYFTSDAQEIKDQEIIETLKGDANEETKNNKKSQKNEEKSKENQEISEEDFQTNQVNNAEASIPLSNKVKINDVINGKLDADNVVVPAKPNSINEDKETSNVGDNESKQVKSKSVDKAIKEEIPKVGSFEDDNQDTNLGVEESKGTYENREEAKDDDSNQLRVKDITVVVILLSLVAYIALNNKDPLTRIGKNIKSKLNFK